jgi:hypothetical protein
LIFYLIRQTNRLSDGDVSDMAKALEYQAKNHLCPAWDIDPLQIIIRVGTESALPPGVIPVTLLDGSSPTEYGDHSFGPGARIYCGAIVEADGYSISSVTSHEVLETIVDPRASNWDPKGYAFEVCDPVQSRSYQINGISVSDFVYPGWFDDEITAGQKLSYCGSVEGPHEIYPGGYACLQASDGTTNDVFSAILPPVWRLAMRSRRRGKLPNNPLHPRGMRKDNP